MDYFVIYQTMKHLDYNSILNLKMVNKQFNNDVTNILKRYFNIIPKYITKNRTFEKHGNDIFITLLSIFKDKHLYQILSYLNSESFKKKKRYTDDYINKEGLLNIIRYKYRNNENDLLDISLFDTNTITNMRHMFQWSIMDKPLNLWDVSNVIDMSYMFCETKYNQPLNLWDVSKVKNMEAMFMESQFNQPLNLWDVTNVEDMSYMFQYSEFNQPINSWDVSKVEDMSYMFRSSNFNQPLNSWDVSKVKDMSYMFRSSNFNQPLNSWDVSKVKIWKRCLWNLNLTNL